MKKIFYILIIVLLGSYLNVLANTCTSSELTSLNEIANNIKINYEVIETKKTIDNEFEFDINTDEVSSGEEDDLGMEENTPSTIDITIESLKITVYNLNKDVFLIQTDDKSSDKKTITYNDTVEGKYVIETDNIEDYINYKFEVYSNLSTCDTTLIKTITYTKPKLNPNADYQICIDNPTVPACQRYITKDTGVSEDKIVDYVNNYLNTQVTTTAKAEEERTTSKNFFKDNIVYIIVGSVLVIGGTAAYIIIAKKRRSL
jgi:hypothetical protein